jgi:hypothetical protein
MRDVASMKACSFWMAGVDGVMTERLAYQTTYESQP